MKLYWPVRVEDGAYINTNNLFGAHPEDYQQFKLKGHNGLDFDFSGDPTGKPIYAAHDGVVEYFEDKDAQGNYRGFGKYAVITHPEGRTYYAHQLKFNGTNRSVKAYDIIGYVDSTGYSTGPHLHFGFKPTNSNYNNGFFGAEDPTPYLADEKEKPNMSNVIFGHKTGTQEYGFWVPATTPDTLKDKALNFGLNIVKADGSVDFALAKEVKFT